MSDTADSTPGSTRSTPEQPSASVPPEAASSTTGGNDASVDTEALKRELIEALKVVRDPEIPVNVVDLGLIYRLEVSEAGEVDIDMTLTSMGCPVQDMIQADAELACMKVEGVRKVNVEFIWSPPWSTDKMTEDGKKQMRMFGFNV